MRPSKSFNTLYAFILLYTTFLVLYFLKAPHFEARKLSLYDMTLDCTSAISGEGNVERLKKWKLNTKAIEETLLASADACATIKDLFGFLTQPLSREEENYPLAYGLVVHKDIVQLLLMLSSIYQPQNEYCLAMSGSSKVIFKSIVKALPQCFPNIHVLNRPPITWGSFEIINSTYSCLEYLTELETPWRYYQYLSGVDVPLRTNLEMVKIFKAWNGTPNIDFVPITPSRLRGKMASASPIPLGKSTLAAIVSRESADYVAKNSKTQDFLHFLRGTRIPDESFWSTLLGNAEEFPAPGSFSAKQVISYRRVLYETKKEEVEEYLTSLEDEESVKDNYYLTRIQVWKIASCKGKMISGSCVFGVSDLPFLLRQPHVVAHKLYVHFEPAALMCALKEVRRRSLNPEYFDTKKYSQLPLVELQRGVPLEKLTNPLWLFSMFGNPWQQF